MFCQAYENVCSLRQNGLILYGSDEQGYVSSLIMTVNRRIDVAFSFFNAPVHICIHSVRSALGGAFFAVPQVLDDQHCAYTGNINSSRILSHSRDNGEMRWVH